MDAIWLSFVGGLLGGSLGAAATLLAASLREKGAKREEWWRRVQWAADLALGKDERRRSVGLYILGNLAGSRLATEDDLMVLDAFSDPGLESLEALPAKESMGDNEGDPRDVIQEGT